MKLLMCGLAVSIGALASSVMAEVTVVVDGEELPLTTLMETCKGMTGDSEAKINCFDDLSKLLEEQSGAVQESGVPVAEALAGLKAVAQYQDDASGLSIVGTDCNIHVVYFNNFFHISRRNVSTIDIFSAQFDASKLQYDQFTEVSGVQAPLHKGIMDDGATATMHGGVELESTELSFAPKAGRTSLDVYAQEVVGQLPANKGKAFDFVLVHPARQQSSKDIWGAFETFVSACNE